MRLLSEYYRQKFGCKVYKLSLDGGFSCPNRDGTLGYGGCIFCDGGGAFAERGGEDIPSQLQRAKERVCRKNQGGKYIAYFQAYTNTYAPVERLEALFTAAMEPEDIVGLSIGTRPDCLGGDVIALLARLNERKPVCVELGLQTIHEETARYIRRGYETAVYFDAVRRLKAAGIEVVTHLILGLPGESREDMIASARASAVGDGVKFHLLHILRGTELEREYRAGKVRCLSLEEYGELLKACVEVLPEEMVLHRITGDGAKRDLVAPLWSGDKKRVLNYLYGVLGVR